MNNILLFIREMKFRIHQLRLRSELVFKGLSCASTVLITTPSVSRIIFGNHCSIGHYTIIDIADINGPHENMEPCLKLGDAVYIGEQCNIRSSGKSIEIGIDTMIANNVVIVSANHKIALGTPMRHQPWSVESGGIVIGSDCWICSHATILSGSNIGNGSIIASGAVVRGNIPPNEVWGGVPAQFIKKRV